MLNETFNIWLPCDWKTIDIFSEKNPNFLGEALRYFSFIGHSGQTGCYETFEVNSIYKQIFDGKYYDKVLNAIGMKDVKNYVYLYECKGCKDEYFNIKPYIFVMGWAWDGDGVLYFRVIRDNRDIEVINYDCKTDYEWEIL